MPTVTDLKRELAELKKSLKPHVPRKCIKWGNHKVIIHKSMVHPEFQKQTVLTDSTWRYVYLFLKENRVKEEVLFYWEQARSFYDATKVLPIEAKALTAYYCFLNASKSLLTFRSIGFDAKHGVSGKRLVGRFHIANEEIVLKERGILSGLAQYFKAPIAIGGETYFLQDVIYNLPYVHRAFTLTHDQPDLFVPIWNPSFVYDKFRNEGWLELEVDKKVTSRTITELKGFGIDRYYTNTGKVILRRNKTFKWIAPRNNPDLASQKALLRYYQNVRKKIDYIYSPNKVWYLKRESLGKAINKPTLLLTFAAMHRLSEMARYEPITLKKHLERKSGWLIIEFIEKSVDQFIDMISSEITGDDFRVTGFRT